MLISIKSFSGTIPRIGSRLLDPNQAEVARNSKFWSGELRPLQEDTAILEIAEPIGNQYNTLYKYDHPAYDPIWFRNEETLNILKGPVANDLKNRTFFTGLDVPRVFNSDQIDEATTALTTTNSYPLGIPKPTQSAELSVSGTGSGSAEARAYLYTYGRQWDTEKFDESEPSSPAEDSSGNLTVDVELGQSVIMSKIKDIQRDDIDYIVIYRSSTGAESSSYNRVIKFNLTDARAGLVSGITYNGTSEEFTFIDTTLTEDLSSALVSLDWTAPLDSLTGIVSLNNGILVGYVGNDLYFSAAYQPHAWPAKYRQTLDYPIHGLGHFGNTVVVLTEAYPLLVTATDPESPTLVPINEVAPCVSINSIVNTGDAVYYASTNGIVQVNSSGITLMTQQLYSKEEWALLNPSSIKAALYEGRYYAFYTTVSGTTDSIVIDFVEANSGVSTISGFYEAYYVDPENNILYYIKRRSDGTRYIWQLEGDTIAHRTYTWKSKKFISNAGVISLAAARVLAELPFRDPYINLETEIQENNAIFSGVDLDGALGELPVGLITIGGDYLTDIYSKYAGVQSVIFKLYVDGLVIHEEKVFINKPFRLPAGVAGTEFQCELSGNVNVFQVDLATSMAEIQ